MKFAITYADGCSGNMGATDFEDLIRKLKEYNELDQVVSIIRLIRYKED